ncbi:MAG: ATP-binding protein [Rhodopirellula bahusiensis]|uniref:histidine kinase n=4 Tax=Rhodopirellula bahusiensis TaxID=2014065 RepID=A0A2G1W3U4_9BACT|nr:ATP-binding protein [Rhodopirellula bahusiensis]PHQ33349.1 HAMP domain-containing histidine kinase [Rhodopirellula bahusiensis]
MVSINESASDEAADSLFSSSATPADGSGTNGQQESSEKTEAKWSSRIPRLRTDSRVWRLSPQGKFPKIGSIQVKLLTGTLVLVALVITLGGVGIIGLYQYRNLADAISSRAKELPMATQIAQAAAKARDSNTRLCQMRAQATMIDPFGMPHSNLQMENDEFQTTINELDSALSRYSTMVTAKIEQPKEVEAGSTLINPETQLASLDTIRSILNNIQSNQNNLDYLVIDRRSSRNKLGEKLDELVGQTRDHLVLIHSQMAAFSDHVKSRYRLGIVVAWVAFAAAMLIAAVMVWVFQTSVLAPFNNLVIGARLVSRGQFGHRIDLGTGDELGELAIILNEMTDRFQNSMAHIEKMCDELDQEVKVRSQEVIRNEQLAGVGFLAAGFAHEINNPMAAIAWSAEAIESRMNDLMMLPDDERLLDSEMTENWRENLQRIEGEAFRCKSIIEKMLLFSRMGQVEKTSFDIVPLVNDVIEMVGTLGKYKCQSVQLFGADSATVYANDQEIRQVILNLVTNALESVDCDGNVNIYINQGPKTSTIRVKDTGCGMSAEVQAHLFEPFFTRRRDGTGTGLGLSISHRIVCQHGGQLSARSEGENRGSEFELRLPIAAITEEVTSPAYESWKFQDAQQTQAA